MHGYKVAAPCGVRLLAFACAVCLAVALAARDSEAAYSKRVEAACKGDYKRLCPNYKAGSLQLRACMEAKAAQISSGCIDALIDSGEVNRQRVKR
ncbi:MAG TPA: hypothetical protein VNK52_01470 [Hyphomicrobiaceae bacterium]|nr:hypothetical protein [Hyphomicrobiaceae bacterium]